jgi:hypothetical protein
MGGMGILFGGVSSIRCFAAKGHLGADSGRGVWAECQRHTICRLVFFSCFRGGVCRIVKELVYRIASDEWDSRSRNGRVVYRDRPPLECGDSSPLFLRLVVDESQFRTFHGKWKAAMNRRTPKIRKGGRTQYGPAKCNMPCRCERYRYTVA